MLCQVCGNPVDPGVTSCPFCGEHITPVNAVAGKIVCKTVNIESGRPFVDEALGRLSAAVTDARQTGIAIIVCIHGYGSSGAGGVIRQECRKTLDYLQQKNKIRGFIPGEEIRKKSGAIRSLFRRFPELATNKDFCGPNPGITIVLLL